jgi:hypothetical protein
MYRWLITSISVLIVLLVSVALVSMGLERFQEVRQARQPFTQPIPDALHEMGRRAVAKFIEPPTVVEPPVVSLHWIYLPLVLFSPGQDSYLSLGTVNSFSHNFSGRLATK